uniref:Protein 2B* n=3 Tax=Cardiovirus A TaxID=1821749 RepID=ALT2B_EMCVR|nr:2B* protein [Encephalomyocarditis virus]P0DJX6.1 RecName: Full=Protein 2B* [cardiovirus A1]P0DJX7.1 RecName: Full=Protein 2B* [Encephalomyocarditis virus]
PFMFRPRKQVFPDPRSGSVINGSNPTAERPCQQSYGISFYGFARCQRGRPKSNEDYKDIKFSIGCMGKCKRNTKQPRVLEAALEQMCAADCRDDNSSDASGPFDSALLRNIDGRRDYKPDKSVRRNSS